MGSRGYWYMIMVETLVKLLTIENADYYDRWISLVLL